MSKTIRNEFEKYLTYEKIMEAHKKSSANKNCRRDVVLFNLKQEAYVNYIYDELKNQTYKHGGYTTFFVHEPKLRKIQKSRYLDRVVHRWLVDNYLIPAFIPQFIYSSYACIKGKGMHMATLDVKRAMLNCKRKWDKYYIIKMDVAKYFQNIDKQILENIIRKKIKDKKLMWLINEILYSAPEEKGIPIGNYTSQIFANIYLNEVDQYIKRELKIENYFRYMDDSIILVKTKKEAIDTLENIRKFISENLKLEFNKKTQIFKSKQGVNFCGYKINEYRIKLREKGKKKLKRKIKRLKQRIKDGTMTSRKAKKYLSGHLGYIKYANIYNLTNIYFIRGKSKASLLRGR